jgi:hypothetical protein
MSSTSTTPVEAGTYRTVPGRRLGVRDVSPQAGSQEPDLVLAAPMGRVPCKDAP